MLHVIDFNLILFFCENTLGYADEEDRHATEAESLQNQQSHQKPKRTGFMSPSPEIHDIVDDNLAADFDGSLSGKQFTEYRGPPIFTVSFSAVLGLVRFQISTKLCQFPGLVWFL